MKRWLLTLGRWLVTCAAIGLVLRAIRLEELLRILRQVDRVGLLVGTLPLAQDSRGSRPFLQELAVLRVRRLLVSRTPTRPRR